MLNTRLTRTAVAAFLVLGVAADTARGGDNLPVLSPVLRKSTTGLNSGADYRADVYEAGLNWLNGQYATILAERRRSGRPLIPPASPIGIGDLVIVANDRAVTSYALRGTEYFPGGPSARGELGWASERTGGFAQMAQGLGTKALSADWIKVHRPDALGDQIFNRTLAYAATFAHGHIHFVDEIALLPTRDEEYMESAQPLAKWGLLIDLVSGNEVKAVDLKTGRLVIKLPSNPIERHSGPPMFLATPLPGADSWYVLDERARKLHLSRVSWENWKKHYPNPIADTDSRVWDTEIAAPKSSVVRDVHRRIHAIHLTEANGLVICPTHLGRVVAVDAATGKVRWTHEYAPVDAKRFPSFAPEWVVVPPVVAGGRYVYAPADFPELLCLDAADGTKVWAAKKGDGLYPAVVGDRVLVVGEKAVRSLSLADGTEQWRLDLPGLPCGRGAALGDTYLVPVSEPKTWKGLIVVVDPTAGKVVEVLKPEKDEPIGNLVVHQDFLLSQTLTEIAAFPLKKR